MARVTVMTYFFERRRKMAQIRKRKNSYQFIVYCGEDMNGKKIEKTMTYHPDPTLTPKQQEKAVLKASLEFEEKVKKGLCMDGDKVTFSEFYKKFKEILCYCPNYFLIKPI